MKTIKRSLLVSALAFCYSGVALAACPPVTGYRATGGDANHCIYTSTKVVQLVLHPPGAPTYRCPEFARFLTDPNYRLTSCRHALVRGEGHCICTTARLHN